MLASSVGLSLYVHNGFSSEHMYDPENRTSGSSQRHSVEKLDGMVKSCFDLQVLYFNTWINFAL